MRALTKITFLLFFSPLLLADMTGALAPDFALKDQDGEVHRLADYNGQWLVVYFYPKDDTPGCTVEANEFKDNYSTLTDLGVTLLGVSLDDAESHAEFKQKYNLPFDLLADDDKTMAKAYGVLGNMVFSYAKRQTFIIDPEGNIAKHYLEVEPKKHALEVINDIQSLQAVLQSLQ